MDFLVRGHTKFGPDTMFASNENTLSREDVISDLYVIYHEFSQFLIIFLFSCLATKLRHLVHVYYYLFSQEIIK